MKAGAANKLLEFYNDKIMAKVVRRFSDDFRTLDYDTDLPLWSLQQ